MNKLAKEQTEEEQTEDIEVTLRTVTTLRDAKEKLAHAKAYLRRLRRELHVLEMDARMDIDEAKMELRQVETELEKELAKRRLDAVK